MNSKSFEVTIELPPSTCPVFPNIREYVTSFYENKVTINVPLNNNSLKRSDVFFSYLKKKKFCELSSFLINSTIIEVLIFGLVHSFHEISQQERTRKRPTRKQHVVPEAFLKNHYMQGRGWKPENIQGKRLITYRGKGFIEVTGATENFMGTQPSYMNLFEVLLSFLESGYANIFTSLKLENMPFNQIQSSDFTRFNIITNNLSVYNKLFASLFMSSINARVYSRNFLLLKQKFTEKEIIQNTFEVLAKLLSDSANLSKFEWTWIVNEDAMSFPFMSAPLISTHNGDEELKKYYFPFSSRVLLLAYKNEVENPLSFAIHSSGHRIPLEEMLKDKISLYYTYKFTNYQDVTNILVQGYKKACMDRINQGESMFWHPQAIPFEGLFRFKKGVFATNGSCFSLQRKAWEKLFKPLILPYSTKTTLYPIIKNVKVLN